MRDGAGLANSIPNWLKPTLGIYCQKLYIANRSGISAGINTKEKT